MSHEGLDTSYAVFKEKFYSRIGSGEIWNCGDINLLKVVLDGLKVNYVKRGRTDSVFKKPISYAILFSIRLYIKAAVKRKAFKNRRINRKIFIGFSARHVEDKKKYLSIYFQTIFEAFGRPHFFYTAEANKDGVHALDYDCKQEDIPEISSFPSWGDIKLYMKIKKTLLTAFKDISFTEDEKNNIHFACHLFWTNYLKWNTFLRQNTFSLALIEQHYHREGFIYACLKNKVPVVELQHGLISEADIFYVFPKQVQTIIKKALFPEKILVYGQHWKSTLLKGCEFTPDQIEIIGYYHYQPEQYKDPELYRIIKDRKVILITTQFSAHGHYIQYAEGLSPRIPEDWMIIIKPHPNEDAALYQGLLIYDNIIVSGCNLDTLLDISRIHISVFSTSLFDGLRYNVCNFTLNLPLFSDYVASMVNSGVAVLLDPTENPVEKYLHLDKSEKSQSRSYYYQPFQKDVFQKYIAACVD